MAAAISSLILVFAIAATTSAAPHERPNIVVVMTDDQSKETIRVMERTRRLLGDEGAAFSRAYVDFPLCCPSRATFLTGRYSHRHGIFDNSGPRGGFRTWEPRHGQDNLALWLQRAGYSTAFVGKYFNGYPIDHGNTYVPPGWTHWIAAIWGPWKSYDYRLNENGEAVSYGSEVDDYRTDVLTDHGVELIDQLAPTEKPFFMWVSYNAPHVDYVGASNPQPPADCGGTVKPAPRHAEAFDDEPLPRPPNFNEEDVSDKPPSIRDRAKLSEDDIEEMERKYRCSLESLLSVDEGVERMVEALEANGELENTIFAFTSDHGWFFGEHRIPQGKNRHYRPSSEVPLLIRGPGIPAGTKLDELTSNVDLAATITDAAEASPEAIFDGASLLPVMRDEGVLPQRDLLIQTQAYAAIRSERFVYVEHKDVQWTPDGGSIELYDLREDPYQLESLHDDPAYAEEKAELADRLSKLRSCKGETCYRTGTEPDPEPEPGPDPEAGPEAGACVNLQRGASGRDRVMGTRFGDRLVGREGDDRLVGRRGADCLNGGDGADRLLGGRGPDRLRGGGDNDALLGGHGRDRLRGGGGRDRLRGGGGEDVLLGGRGRDRLRGGKGDDVLVGRRGRDRLRGGPGDDRLRSVDGQRDLVHCGAGDADIAIVDGRDRTRGCEHLKVRRGLRGGPGRRTGP